MICGFRGGEDAYCGPLYYDTVQAHKLGPPKWRHEPDRSPYFFAEDKNEWLYTSPSTYAFMAYTEKTLPCVFYL
jgi:hypothetical protein